jgi:membrane protein implicated in regulation of membrane protease activity
MAARDTGRFGSVSSVASVEGASTPAKRPPWYRRVGFWRAVAGMALAIALASAIVTAEFSTQLLQRTRHFHHRLNQLTSKLTTMRGKIASADREIAGMRITVEIDDSLRRILAEPDARIIRLAPPGQTSQRVGVIAFSPALRRAAIEIAGLTASPAGNSFSLWWTRGKHGPPLWAARFSAGAGGKAGLMIALPAADQTINGAMITADSSATKDQPQGATILQGEVAPALAPSVKTRHKIG